MTRHDLRDLAALTALGLVLGLVHLAGRGLPLLAAPAALCSGGAAAEPEFAEPVESRIDGEGR